MLTTRVRTRSYVARSQTTHLALPQPNTPHRHALVRCQPPTKDNGPSPGPPPDPTTTSTTHSPLEWLLHGDWAPQLIKGVLGGGGTGQNGAESTMPQVRVNLTDAAKMPVFMLLNELASRHGPLIRMSLGPKSFLVVSDPSYVKQILVTNVDKYGKGILAEILDFVMGQGLVTADGDHWMGRRRAVAPALQRKFVSSQVALFGQVASRGVGVLEAAAASGSSVEMEGLFSRMSLDVVGKAVFDYEFDALSRDDPVIQSIYTVLKEAESRSTAPFPYWHLPGATLLVPRLRTADAAVKVVNETLDKLVARCKELVDSEGKLFNPEDPTSPSVLHYLVASGQDPFSRQLRDDLVTLLIAGHETTAAALTWALYLLAGHPHTVAAVRQEVDSVCGDRLPTVEDLPRLPYTARVVAEALRLFPQPPVLIRRAVQDDLLGGVHPVPAGTDLFINVWTLHRSPKLWEDPEAFKPERFGPLDGPFPTEVNTDFRYFPFGGGRRKCVGDQFALLQSVVALAVLLRRFDFAPDTSKPPVGWTTGATIHTTAGLHMLVTRRDTSSLPPPQQSQSSAGPAASGCPHAAAAAAAAVAEAAAQSGGCPYTTAASAASRDGAGVVSFADGGAV